jgi:hypothetical protein
MLSVEPPTCAVQVREIASNAAKFTIPLLIDELHLFLLLSYFVFRRFGQLLLP